MSEDLDWNIEYNYTTDDLAIRWYLGELGDGKLTFPALINGKHVVQVKNTGYRSSIFPNTFNADDMRVIDMSEAIYLKKIDKNSFYSMNKLEEVIFPESLNYIGRSAFEYNSKLEELDLSKTQIDTLQHRVFSNCNLHEVLLPKSLKHIISEAFTFNDNLTKIHITRDKTPLTTLSQSSFIWSPISNGSKRSVIYYPIGTDYPNMENWKDLDVEWVEVE